MLCAQCIQEDVCLLEVGLGVQCLEELGFLGRGGGTVPKSNLPPPPTEKTKPKGKKGGLDTIEKPLIIGEPPRKIRNIVVTKTKKKTLKTKRGKWGKCGSKKNEEIE